MVNLRPHIKVYNHETKITAYCNRHAVYSTAIKSTNRIKNYRPGKDNTGKAITAATVTLNNAKDSSLVKTGVTNTDGNYELPGINQVNISLLLPLLVCRKKLLP
ncbi:MAG: carboxypeptidase-like regulatory domain-containing protein [Ferruginibacter sp.]